jgi:hypothetical protein
MRNNLNKKVVVRITDEQFLHLQRRIHVDKLSMSQVIREAISNKLNKIEIDDFRKRKIRH